MKSLDKKRFAREVEREERDDMTLDDLSDAMKAMAGPQQTPPTKREPTAQERKMRFKLERRG